MNNTILQEILNPPCLWPPILPTALIRTKEADFEVEEIPAYQPGGSGEHLFLWIEKRGVAAAELIARLARILQIQSSEIGVAGQKDRHAVTRQFVSVPRRCEPRLSGLDSSEIRILNATPHSNKLRTGHLHGNRFRILLRSPGAPWSDADATSAALRLRQLCDSGFPSYFGPQRFGRDGASLDDGLALLKGQLSRRKWPFHQQRFMMRMVLSAVQSAVFNLVVASRVQDGTVQSPIPGDVVIRQHGSRPFLLPPAEPAATDGTDESIPHSTDPNSQPIRLIPAGPMHGPNMLSSAGVVVETEERMLAGLELSGSEFQRFAKLCSGTRRAMLEFPDDVSAQLLHEADRRQDTPSAVHADNVPQPFFNPQPALNPQSAPCPQSALELRFSLRSGTYATVLLRELCRHMINSAAGVSPSDADVELPEAT